MTCRAGTNEAVWLSSRSQYAKQVLKFRAQLTNHLLRLSVVVFHGITRKVQPRSAYRVAILIQQASYLADKHDVVPLIISAITSALYRFKIWKLLFPVTEYVGLYQAQVADFANREVAFVRYRG